MSFHWVDWSIVGGLLLVIVAAAIGTKKYMRSVADFLSANRCAGKYMLGVADGIAGLGAITIAWYFQMHYKGGYAALWWNLMLTATLVVVAVTGWIQYRYRETRAMTLAQFFEMRYSRSFRVFAGIVAVTAGVFNFAIFPSVGGHFFQYYCGFEPYMVQLGPLEVDLVYGAIMFFLLAVALYFTFMGGQIAVMVTDFIQGMFANIVFVIICGGLLFVIFNWDTLMAAVSLAPENASLINPMNMEETKNYDPLFFIIGTFGAIYTFRAWQGSQGYYTSAKSPHDARMGAVIGQLRFVVQMLPLVLIAVCAFAFLNSPDFAKSSEVAHKALESIDNEQIRSQMTVPVAARNFLPIGLVGAFAGVMLAAFISTHDTYLHAWGSIFIQDVVMPIRQAATGSDEPFSPKAHIRLLRLSILAVAIFIFLFSLLFYQRQDIAMYFALTGNVFLGWAGTVIVGGLYWKRGTTAGAWASGTFGVVLAVFVFFITQFWSVHVQPFILNRMPGFWAFMQNGLSEKRLGYLADGQCPITGQEWWGIIMLLTIIVYGVVSLLTSTRKGIDMEQLLHRGRYKVETDASEPKVKTGLAVFGISRDFSLGDRILFIISNGLIVGFLLLFILGTAYMYLVRPISDEGWGNFWLIFSIVLFVFMVVITTWISIGGIRDMRRMYATLRTLKRDARDDGTVVGHRLLAEVEESEIEPDRETGDSEGKKGGL